MIYTNVFVSASAKSLNRADILTLSVEYINTFTTDRIYDIKSIIIIYYITLGIYNHIFRTF